MSEPEQSGVEATVVELLPRRTFRVELDDRRQVLAHPAGAAVLNTTRLRPGDRVRVAISPHDATRGRIIRLVGKG